MNKTGVITVLTFLISNCWGAFYTLKINQGLLNGTNKYNRKGGIFYSFQSIPYGKPPLGTLRFKESEPAGGWDGVRDATEDLPVCHQQERDGTVGIGQEDCLYLNVYTPQLPSENYDTLKSVMVHIHGGGFRANSGGEKLLGPDFLLTEDIVLVTINYRLGIFGSFNLEDSTLGYPGNIQLKDQILALKWVQTNIAQFGGNPDDVTIFGQSAGSVSVHYLILSPLAAGTFHKAIAESGTALGPWTVGVRDNGLLLAEVLNISTDDKEEMINQLLSKTGDEIYEGQQTLKSQLNLRWGDLSYPIVENKVEGQNAILTENPLTMIQSGNYNQVPTIIGYADAEGLSYFTQFTNLYGLVPEDLDIVEDSEDANNLTEEMENFYFGDSGVSTDDDGTIIQMYTDVYFAYPAYRVAREQQKTARYPIYFYRFSADTTLNVYKLRKENLRNYPGANHGDDTGYLFKSYYNEMYSVIEPGNIEDKAIDRMVTLWTNFAKHGNPTPDDFVDFKWAPITEDIFSYIDFGSNDTIPGVNPDADNMQFWSKVYDKYFKEENL